MRNRNRREIATQNDTLGGQQDDLALVGAYKERDRPRKPPICWSCEEVGHIQRYCPKERNSKLSHKATTTEEKSPDSDHSGKGAFTVSHNLPEMGKWLVDSGASSHMTPQKEFLVNYCEFSTLEKVGLGDGRIMEAAGVGNVHLNMLFKVGNSK